MKILRHRSSGAPSSGRAPSPEPRLGTSRESAPPSPSARRVTLEVDVCELAAPQAAQPRASERLEPEAPAAVSPERARRGFWVRLGRGALFGRKPAVARRSDPALAAAALPADRRGRIRRFFDRWADRTADAVVEKYARKYALDPEQRALVARRVETAKLGKSMEHWLRRMGVHAAAVTAATAVGSGIAVAIGVLAPPALGAVAVTLVVTVAGALYVLQRRLRNALEGAAEMALLELGIVAKRKTLIRRLAQRRAEAVVSAYAEAFALTPEEIAKVEKEVQKVKAGREKEFWQKQLQAEMLAGVSSVAVSGAAGLLLGGAGPMGLIPIGVGLATMTGVNLYVQYSKLSIALDATAFATVAELRGIAPQDGPLARHAKRRARQIVAKYVARYAMNEAEQRELEAKGAKVRDLKLDEFLRKRQVAYIGGPTARATATTLTNFAAGATSLSGLFAGLIMAAGTVAQSSYLLYKRFDQAVEGVVFAAAEDIVRRRSI